MKYFTGILEKHLFEKGDYGYIEPITFDMIKFNDVKIEKYMIANHIRTHGFIWVDDFGLDWNMSVIKIVNTDTNTFNIVAVKD